LTRYSKTLQGKNNGYERNKIYSLVLHNWILKDTGALNSDEDTQNCCIEKMNPLKIKR